MRVAIALSILVAACVPQDTSDPYPVGPDPGWSPPPGGYGCQQDSDCGSNLVCAQDFSCRTADQVYTAHITWTISGAAPDATSCARAGDLDLQFWTNQNDEFGYAPVPCLEGKFTILKLPLEYNVASVGQQGDTRFAAAIDPKTGLCSVDMSY